MTLLGRRTRFLTSIFLILLTLSLAACGSSSQTGSSSTKTSNTVINVVAAENFWGSIAAQVGGSHVHVTSIITNPDADPHDYDPTSVDARNVATAQYVIINGVGYDPWASKLVTGNPNSDRKVLTVGDLFGKKDGDNPHLWYNPDYVTSAINKMRDDFKSIDPSDAAAFDKSAQDYETNGLKEYHDTIAAIKAKYSNVPVGATESIFSYQAPALGLNLVTPYSYLKAVSEGTDISASDEAKVEQQVNDGQIKILVYNSQNTPNNITSLINKAKAKNIPVATITETLTPANATFQDWQVKQLQGIQSALATATGK